jgi:hypothetical protein
VYFLLKHWRALLSSIIPLLLISVGHAAQPMPDLAEFSRIKNLNLSELAGGAIAAERRTEIKMETGLAAEACFVIRQPATVVLKRLERWNSAGNPHLDVLRHGSISAPVKMSDFESIEIPEAEKRSRLQLLAAHAQAFQHGGLRGIDTKRANSQLRSPAREFAELLSELKQWSEYYRPILETGGIQGAPRNYYGYWEEITVEGKKAIVLGSFTSTPAHGGFQALDLQYFATSGFSVAATLYQLWPIRVGNSDATLVWRCSMVSTPRVKELHGVERRAAGVAFKNRVKKYAEAIAADFQ